MSNLLYYELNEMSDVELLAYVQGKIDKGEDFCKAHVSVYGVLCNRHGDETAYEMMGTLKNNIQN